MRRFVGFCLFFCLSSGLACSATGADETDPTRVYQWPNEYGKSQVTRIEYRYDAVKKTAWLWAQALEYLPSPKGGAYDYEYIPTQYLVAVPTLRFSSDPSEIVANDASGKPVVCARLSRRGKVRPTGQCLISQRPGTKTEGKGKRAFTYPTIDIHFEAR